MCLLTAVLVCETQYFYSYRKFIYHDFFFFLGGWPTKSLNYIYKFGISDGLKYKYANSKQLCQKGRYHPIANLTRYKVCEKNLKGNETELRAIVAKGPAIVGFVS